MYAPFNGRSKQKVTESLKYFNFHTRQGRCFLFQQQQSIYALVSTTWYQVISFVILIHFYCIKLFIIIINVNLHQSLEATATEQRKSPSKKCRTYFNNGMAGYSLSILNFKWQLIYSNTYKFSIFFLSSYYFIISFPF